MSSPRKRPKQTGSSSSEPPSIDNLREWTVDEVYNFFTSKGLDHAAKCLKDQEISGENLLVLNEDHLKEIGIKSLGKRLELQRILQEMQTKISCVSRDADYKVINDSIHGHIVLHPLCISIMDTVQFQRLRQIKQLGGCYYVFPGAAHNRFEHSIGVSHLAGKLARALQMRQPSLDITDKDVLCVEIAGLCHDLGHGPFSHMFDRIFIPRITGEKWKHEKASVAMFDHLIEENKLKGKFESHGLNETDITFIKEQIYGPLLDKKDLEGRPKKPFLYEIVANKRTGIDVDKWDYFARDCHMLGISNSFDYNRFIKFAKVMEVDGQYQICTRDQEVGNVYDMFHTRNSLHRSAYKHKATMIIEEMIVEALVLANDHLLITGTNGDTCKMSETIRNENITAYTNMTDIILYQVLNTKGPELKQSRDIITDILSRKLYKYIGQTSLEGDDDLPIPSKSIQKFTAKMKDELVGLKEAGYLEASNLVIHVVDLNYGMKSENPVDNMRFYSKRYPNKAFPISKEEVSKFIPDIFSEQQIRVYCKLRDEESVDNATRCFKKWCDNRTAEARLEKEELEKTPNKQDPQAKKQTPQKPKKEERPQTKRVESVKKRLYKR